MDFQLITSRAFTAEDQQWFADVSGDCNPMHMDVVASRRTQAGTTVVHGIHALLWALDALARQADADFTSVTAKFERFVAVGETVDLWLKTGANFTQLEIRNGTVRLISVRVSHDPARRASGATVVSDIPADSLLKAPRDLSFEEAAQTQGALLLLEAGDRYTALQARIGPDGVAALSALSYLVGMVTPGLHSIFSRLTVAFRAGSTDGGMAYRVADAHDVFRLLTLDVSAPAFDGQVEAFVRLPPVVQPMTADLMARVRSDEFAGVSALIIGGSRGLGEITAKLLAAGGARVAVSYAVGAKDAQLVADDIASAGGQCDILPIDVRRPMTPQLAALGFAPTQVYYFATSKIFLQKADIFEPAVFAEFQKIYVDGFYDLCRVLSERNTGDVAVYYPSSVAIDERPRHMTEYTMAKAAAEILCADIDKDMPRVATHVTRLPRLLTDQTATVTPVETPDASAVMLDIVRAMTAKA